MIVTFSINCEKKILVQRDPSDVPEFAQSPAVDNILYSSAEVSWSINEPCTTQVHFWIPGASDTFRVSDDEFRQDHTARLLGLDDDTEYNFQVKCFNRYDYSNESKIYDFITIFDYTDFVEKGWASFEKEDFDSSEYFFTEYLNYVPQSFDASKGAGWTFCKLNQSDSAEKYFDRALVINDQDDDVIAGKTLNSYKKSQYSESLKYGKIIHNKALNYWADNSESYNPVDSAFYVFQHDSSFNNLDVSLMLADSYCQTLDFSSSRTVIYFIYPEIHIFPAKKDSWVVDSVKYEKFEDAMGALIDSLKTEYWENGQFPQ